MLKLEIKGKGEIIEVSRGEKYRIKFKYRDPSTGKWKYAPQRTIKGNKAKARRELETYKAEFELEWNEPKSTSTFGDYARDWQQTRRELATITVLALDRDEIEIARINEYLGHITMTDLTADDIEGSILALKKKGLSESALHKYWQKVNQILKHAVKRRVIPFNPCDQLEPIKRPDAKERKALNFEQAAKFALALKNENRDGKIVAVWLALALGLRRGECLGLRWTDVDFDERIVHIRKQYDVHHNLRKPKCASIRDLPVDEGTIAFLREWQSIILTMFPFSEIPDELPVCCTDTGSFIDPTFFDKWRRKFFVNHGLGKFTTVEQWHDKRGIKRYRCSGYEGYNLHELRHTQATLLIGLGADLKAVQDIMGHSSMQMTMQYTHSITANQRKATSAFDQAILQAR
jgi:Site-specific recombinase XerD